MSVIRVSNVTKEYKLYGSQNARFKALFSDKVKYRPKVAVSNCSFEIEKGEKVAIIGLNGAGKTTLLKMLMGTVFPTKGEIEVEGRITPVIGNSIGFDQNFTARENINYRASLLGLDKEETEKFAEGVTEFAELGEYVDQPLRTFSVAMKSKLSYAMSVMLDVDILMMDETVSAGDGDFKKKCLTHLKEMLSDENLTFIYATHMPRVAKKYCTRGIVMKKGEIVFDGPILDAVEFYMSTTSKKEMGQPDIIEMDDLQAEDEDFDEEV